MKTLNFSNAVTLNFNLREPKKVSGETNIYAVVKVEGKQIKISLGCKVCAWNWNAKKQIPIITDGMTDKAIENAMAINEVINEVRTKFYYYLCSGQTISETTIKEVLAIETKDMANKNAIPPKKTKTATKLLLEAFESHYGTEENPKSVAVSSWKRYHYQLKRFLEYLKQPNVYDSANTLSNKTMYNYKEFLAKKQEKEGKGSENNVVKQCNLIILLINDIANNLNHERLGVKHIEPMKEKKVIKKAESKKRELTDQEINAVSCVALNDKKLEFYRDCFIMQVNSGVRVSDLPKLFTHDYKVMEQDGKQLLQIVSKKENITAVVIVNEEIKTLLEKYANGVPFAISKDTYNRALKQIFEGANLTYLEAYTTEINGTKKEVKERLCDIISSHYCRHTFITRKLREGWSFDRVCYLTGHATDAQIREVYEHLTEKDKGHAVLQELDKIENKQDNENKRESNDIQNLITECKDVLCFLGAKYEDVADINDIDTLSYMVYHEYFVPFENNGIDVKELKQIYNTQGITFKEKKQALATLICEAKEKSLSSK